MSSVARPWLFFLGLLLFMVSWLSSPIQAEVVTLTDETFEHQTQASTGMTTGSWLVLFSVPDCHSCEAIKPVLENLGSDEEVHERGIVLGSVDCSKNSGVCLRFSTSKLPVLLYLHKKQMYTVPRDEEFGNLPTLENLKSFVLGPTSQAEPIPDPPSALGELVKQLKMMSETNPMAGYAVMGMAVMMGFTILVLVVTLIKAGISSSSTTTDKKGKTKTKSSKKNK
jgi:thiol-disulfide isomerase/thioredoxin